MSTSSQSPVLGSVLTAARSLVQQVRAEHSSLAPASREVPAGDQPVHEPGRARSELASQHQLSAMTVHDLCSPAQVILGLSELMLEQPALEPLLRRRLEQMHRSAMTMSAMITDLSAGLSGSTAAGFGPERHDGAPGERVNLAELVTSVVERTRVLASEKDLRVLLLVDRLDEQGCWVAGDAVKLERALVNLLGNAIKFSPPSSTVSVTLDRRGEHAEIAVGDQGPGISVEGRARIFEAYHREQSTAHLPGQGLGLFITKQIVEAHDGTLGVDSHPGCGATFVMQLPLAAEHTFVAGA